MHRRGRFRIAAVVAVATGMAAAFGGIAGVQAGQEARIAELTAAANEVLGLEASHLERLDIDGAIGQDVRTQVTIEGQRLTLELAPHSIRADGYEVRAQGAGGGWVVADPTPEKTLRGRVAEIPGALVAGALLDDGLTVTILLPGGERHWVEPAAGHVPGAEHLHVVYAQDDVVPHGGSCGSDHLRLDPADGPQDDGLGGVAGADPSFLCTAELATDADVEYFNDYGSVSAVEDRINLVINTMNLQYESEVSITHVLTTILVRTAEPDPYSSFDNNDLLCQFINEWTNNQQGVVRDVAHLFTGREIAGSVIGQAAELGSLCEPDGCTTFPCNCEEPFGTKGSYCFSQSDFNGSFACATDLSAHELGHLWSAVHCACAGPDFTMNSFITCANTFSAATRDDIISYRDVQPCIECLGALTFDFPNGRPDLIAPDGGTTVRVEVLPGSGEPESGTGLFHLSIDGGPFNALPMAEVLPNVYDAAFPAVACGASTEYFFSAETTTAILVNEPLNAPDQAFIATSALGETVVLDDDFESDLGWAVTNSGLTDGAWERGVPAGGGGRGDPPVDFDGSGQCYLTDNVSGNSDVDGGSTTLTSPVMDATSGIPLISYARWFHNSFGDNPFTETMTIEVSDDGGGSWSTLEIVGPAGAEVSGGWFVKQFDITDAGIAATSQFRIRYTTQDPEPGSVVEAAVDAVKLRAIDCEGKEECTADLNGDTVVDTVDLLALLGAWGTDPNGPPDFNNDDTVDTVDLLLLLGFWGPCP